MLEIGQEWLLYTTPFRLAEVSSAPTGGEILPNAVSLYAKDNGSGVSNLYWKNDAGTEFDLANLLGGSGSGASGRVAFWSSASALSSTSTFFWDNSNKRLGIGTGSPGVDLEVSSNGAADVVFKLINTQATTFGAVIQLGVNSLVKGGVIAVGGNGFFSDIALTNDIVLRASDTSGNNNLIIAARNASGVIKFTTANPDTEKMRITSGGDLLLGFSAIPATGWQSGRGLFVHRTASPAEVEVGAYGANTQGAVFRGIHSRGSVASPTQSLTDDSIDFAGCWSVDTAGVDGTAGAVVRMAAANNWSSTSRGTRISFLTTPIGSTTASRAERFRVGPSGEWGIGGATYGSSGDIFSSGGASAAPTWVTRATLNAALDHGLLTGNGDDDHTIYALLAGRSGGQTIIGGTAAADDLILQATSGNGVGSETIVFKLGNNGARTVATLIKTNGGTAELQLNSAEASKQFNLEFQDNGTNKWIIYKTTGNNFSIYDAVANDDVLLFTPIGSIGAAGSAVAFDPSINNSNATTIGFLIRPTFTGAGEGPWGGSIAGIFQPSASVGACYNSLNNPTFSPGSGVTITGAFGAYYGLTFGNTSGAVTNGWTLWLNPPTFSGSLKPTTSYGMYVGNMGAAGITTSAALYIDSQTGSTNNYVFLFGGNVDTSAAGAYYGKLPVIYNGLLKYIHLFS